MKKYSRYWLIGIMIFFLGFGTFFLATFSAVKSLDNFGEPNHYLFRHLIRIGIGLVLCFAAFKIPLSLIIKIAPFALAGNILLSIAVPLFGIAFGGAKRWISVGGTMFQPAEFLKIAFVIYTAAWLTRVREKITSFKNGVLPICSIAVLESSTPLLRLGHSP